MGEQNLQADAVDPGRIRAFTQLLLQDLRALQWMIEHDALETGARRLGAEQELFLVDDAGRPAPSAMEVLAAIADSHFTTELGRFNLEFNLDPLPLGPGCLRRLEEDLATLLERASAGAHACSSEVVLTGILPSLEKSDLGLDNMAPVPRYRLLNEVMTRLRGGDYQFYIRGRDELLIHHDNVMLEACNTSFQVHYQVDVGDFARCYNVAQMIAGPVLACAVNSPLLFGRQLWRETRIALFEQAVDMRSPSYHLRDQLGRVSFGRRWVDESPLEIYQDDLSRFRVLLHDEVEEDPFAVLAEGGAPALKALRLYNGTIYRWNRPCYGVTDGRPHLRIENRVLPAGPTVLDEVANAALWLGLMVVLPDQWREVHPRMAFGAARENFVAAARLGLGATLEWPDRGQIGVRELLLQELLPLARHGLGAAGLPGEERDRYLDIVEERVRSGRTGAQWLLDSFAALQTVTTRVEALATLVTATVERQREGRAVHEWSMPTLAAAGAPRRRYRRVEELMTTDLFTVNEEDVVDMVAAVMRWRHVRRIPVEDHQHRLVGLVTYRSLLRVLSESLDAGRPTGLAVRDVMQREVVTVQPETSLIEALRLMRQHRIGCLPVVDREHCLVGIVTEHDFMAIAEPLLERALEPE
jgi:CBS domain-containing protein